MGWGYSLFETIVCCTFIVQWAVAIVCLKTVVCGNCIVQLAGAKVRLKLSFAATV